VLTLLVEVKCSSLVDGMENSFSMIYIFLIWKLWHGLNQLVLAQLLPQEWVIVLYKSEQISLFKAGSISIKKNIVKLV
jgi:hypothetical protein